MLAEVSDRALEESKVAVKTSEAVVPGSAVITALSTANTP